MGAPKQGDIAAAPELAELVDATVAPGRTVHTTRETYRVWDQTKGDEGDWRNLVRLGKPVGPGGTVRLPQPEVERLQALGFLVKPGAAMLPRGNGPTFGVSDGPSITETA